MGEQEAAGELGPQLTRRRRRSLLAALERVGRAEEEEEKEEEFEPPRQQEDSGFSVNKCIIAALILLGLGTIFFSGEYHLHFPPGERKVPCAPRLLLSVLRCFLPAGLFMELDEGRRCMTVPQLHL